MRTPITLKIKFKSGSLDQFIERYSVDVSRGGIFIRTKEPLAVGTQLKFEFQLQDASSLIAGEGTVVWIREHDPNRSGVAPGMGVRFDRLQPTSQQVLDRILTEKSKRGDAQMESRFDAGVRASATASGTVSTPDKAAAHNQFGGGDSKSHTPLPAPVPGLDSPHDEFAEESTRVMQNEIVQALADKTREDAHAMTFDNEPTRRATKEQVEALSAKSTEPSKVEIAEAPKPAEKVEVAAAVAPSPSPSPSKEPEKEPEKIAAAPAEKKEPEKKIVKEAERPAATAAPVPAAKRSSGGAVAVFVVLALAVGGGAYYALRGPTDEGKTVTDNTPPNQPPQPKLPPVVTERAHPPEETPPEVVKPQQVAVKPEVKPEAPKGLSVPVTSDPPGAQVVVDGKPLPEPTPTSLGGLDAKKVYDVKLSLKGFHTFAVKLKPKTGEKLDAALVPNEKLVEVSSTPQGADVLLDGKKVGRTPFTIHKIDVTKPHELQIKHSGFVAQSHTVSAGDTFESKGDKEVLALALKLEPEAKVEKPEQPKVAATVKKKPAVKKPVEKPAEKPEVAAEKPEVAAEKPAEKPETVAEKPVDKPVVDKPADKPAVEKPEKPAVEKPAAEKKPAVEKPAAEKPAVEKPAEKPADKQQIKVPSWMKAKTPAEGTPPEPTTP